jgi:Ca-activated chloride channel family protein
LDVGLEESAVRALLAVLLAVAALGLRPWVQEPGGNRAYRKGDYARAAERYRAVMARRGADPRLSYNLGTALLRLGESELAYERLSESLDARSPELRARAFYNLGNSLIGRSGGENAGDLRAAMAAYRRSLLLDPTRDEARWNLELASHRLEQLESGQPSPTSPEQRPSVTPAGEPGDEREGLRGEQSRTGAAGSGSQLQGERADRGLADSPLTKELAEQILRAVEERERGLQRDKLRKERRQARGPDW